MPARNSKQAVMEAPAAPTPDVNEAEAYGARLVPADVAPGARYWQVTNVRHLTPDENRGKHNIFVRAFDEADQRDRHPALRATYTWDGRRPDEAAPPRQLDKRDGEIGHGDIDVDKGQRIEVWLEGDGLPSDRVANLHTDHDVIERTRDGETGNSRFHHSYLVTFQRTQKPVHTDGDADGETDEAEFLREEDTVVDGTLLAPGTRFTKRWVLRNRDSRPWGEGYRLVFVEGAQMGAANTIPIPPTPAGAEVTVAVDLVAPATPGEVRSDWQLEAPDGRRFGPRVWALVAVAAGEQAAGQEGRFPPPEEQQIKLGAGAGPLAQEVARFWNRYGGLVLDESARLGIDPADAVAVLITESSGRPFGADGRMVIRFENHLFWHFWGAANRATFEQHFAYDPDTTWQGHRWRPDPNGPWRACHEGDAQEWQVLDFARRLDDTAALKSISMGAAQIMGFNHNTLGYDSPQAMFAAFERDAGAQLRALFRFMEVNGLVEAVRGRRYRAFALAYNGSGQPDYYAGKMSEYAGAFAALQPAALAAAAATTPMVDLLPLAAAPMPPSPVPGVPLAQADPRLYAIWRQHVEAGFKQNETMFASILRGFMNPYWVTVWMYGILFGVGVASFVVAAIVALVQNNSVTALAFGGLSVAAFLTFFISRPLQALEENLQFITWLGVIYNTYWTALAQAQNPERFLADLDKVTEQTLRRLGSLMDKHAARSGARPRAGGE